MTELDFVGEPFDALAWTTPAGPPAPAAPPVAPVAPGASAALLPPVEPDESASVAPGESPGRVAAAAVFAAGASDTSASSTAVDRLGSAAGGSVADLVREMRLAVVRSHEQMLRAQTALQRRALRMDGHASGSMAGPEFVAEPPTAAAGPTPVDSEARFKLLARTAVTELDATALGRLAAGDIAAVFGPDYAQDGANPDIRLGGSAVVAVSGLALYGGAWGSGSLAARLELSVPDRAAVVEAVVQAAQIYALSVGLQLCLADATFECEAPGLPVQPVRVELGSLGSGDLDLVLEVTEIDLVPRPYLRVEAEISVAGSPLGRVRGVTVAVVEKPGVPIGPELGGVPARWLGRMGRFGDRALLSEFHLAQMCRGDQGIGLGPEFTPNSARKATRPPDRGLLLVDRFMEMSGTRGVLDSGSHTTEYDSPADSWYYRDTANASMPNCVYMETSLQAALLLGYYLGPTLADPDATVSLRNLGGTATVLREVDLRDTTIVEHSQLLSTSPMPGSTLQSFAYARTVDGEPFYEGETLFGYFSDAAMANQTGLDAGRHVPTWLDSQPVRPATRTIDIAARRADPNARLVSRDHLALLDRVQVVDDGGIFGKGYLHAVQPIDPSHWVFARHFRCDPVIPGSFGIETCIQAMQEWLLDSGLGEGMRDPGFVLPAGLPFTWKYRGQFLPTDGECTLEVHLKRIQQRPGRIRVVGEASMWKPGLRIYELSDIAVELREEGAQPW
ncbi:beta-ketoacyl synthase [Nocardia crassostreae]|uniref:beta-ketoacyl synthase n=1 Tax=Nocardia crassostreae TaxID=53428 RepID=UPI00082BFCDB|nr:beta-ketoacyl synthase [Nocardia crassostreae]